MIVRQTRPAGFFSRQGKWLLLGAGIGTACAALTVGALLLIGGGAKAAGVSLSGDAIYGQGVTMEVAVENDGVFPAKYRAVLTVDGSQAAVQEVKLQGGEKATIPMELSGLANGNHTIAVGGKETDITVLMPAHFTVTGIQVQPENPLPGDDVTVTATVKNSGEVAGDYSAGFLLDGKNAAAAQVTVGPGSEQTVTVTLKAVARGAHAVSLEGVSKAFSALQPAQIDVAGLNLSSGYARPGEDVTVFMNLKNSGDVSGSYDLKLSIDGAPAADQSVYLNGNAVSTFTYIFSEAKEGDYDVQAGDYTQTLQVVDISQPATGTLFVKSANGGYCTLAIKNAYDSDVIVTLAASSDPGTAVLSFYLRAGEKNKSIHVKNGTYIVYYTTGKDYAPKLKKFMQVYGYREDGTIKCTTYTTTSYVWEGWEEIKETTTHYYMYDFSVGPSDNSASILENGYPK